MPLCKEKAFPVSIVQASAIIKFILSKFIINSFEIIVCGGKLKAQSTVEHFYSHVKYGDADYEKMDDCDWNIEAADPNKRIRIKFLTFELEYEQDCGYDYLAVYDGSYDDLVLMLGKYCGNTVSFARN